MSGALASPNQIITSLDEDALQELYTWIDEISLSRPKRNIWRDFSDGGELMIFTQEAPLTRKWFSGRSCIRSNWNNLGVKF